MRAQLMKFRIMQTNALRGLLYEFGVVLPEGVRALAKSVTADQGIRQQVPRLSPPGANLVTASVDLVPAVLPASA